MSADEYIMQIACDKICFFAKTATAEEDLVENVCSSCPLMKAMDEVFCGYGEDEK